MEAGSMREIHRPTQATMTIIKHFMDQHLGGSVVAEAKNITPEDMSGNIYKSEKCSRYVNGQFGTIGC
jgi:hypothetical protein